ncbi:hypothetical protein B296_00049563 [Ensete ventricosum]|uniref:Uncharacterized protein n=1 Tax=Ensete ventricosum TaxID=4639 RepID=A0A426XY03_ENSVE|nr:hypothetical protein B296_00049563 [Ensete ventricosum]
MAIKRKRRLCGMEGWAAMVEATARVVGSSSIVTIVPRCKSPKKGGLDTLEPQGNKGKDNGGKAGVAELTIGALKIEADDDLTAVDFDANVSLAEKEQMILLEPDCPLLLEMSDINYLFVVIVEELIRSIDLFNGESLLSLDSGRGRRGAECIFHGDDDEDAADTTIGRERMLAAVQQRMTGLRLLGADASSEGTSMAGRVGPAVAAEEAVVLRKKMLVMPK